MSGNTQETESVPTVRSQQGLAQQPAHHGYSESSTGSTSSGGSYWSKSSEKWSTAALHHGENRVGECDVPDKEPHASGVMLKKWKAADPDQWFEYYLSTEGEQRRAKRHMRLSQQTHDTDGSLYTYEVPHRLSQTPREDRLARDQRTQGNTTPYEKPSHLLSKSKNGEVKQVLEESSTCLQVTNSDQLNVEIEITNLFKKWLEQCLKSRTSHAGSCKDGQAAPPALGEGWKAQETRNRKRSGDSRGYGSNEEDEGDESNRNPAKKKRRGSHGDGKRLGCPFFKHNPDNHRQYPSCYGQGFWNTHDMK